MLFRQERQTTRGAVRTGLSWYRERTKSKGTVVPAGIGARARQQLLGSTNWALLPALVFALSPPPIRNLASNISWQHWAA